MFYKFCSFTYFSHFLKFSCPHWLFLHCFLPFLFLSFIPQSFVHLCVWLLICLFFLHFFICLSLPPSSPFPFFFTLLLLLFSFLLFFEIYLLNCLSIVEATHQLNPLVADEAGLTQCIEDIHKVIIVIIISVDKCFIFMLWSIPVFRKLWDLPYCKEIRKTFKFYWIRYTETTSGQIKCQDPGNSQMVFRSKKSRENS